MSFELIVAAMDGNSHPTGGNRGPAFAFGGPAATRLPPSPSTVPTWIIPAEMLHLPGSAHNGSARATVAWPGDR